MKLLLALASDYYRRYRLGLLMSFIFILPLKLSVAFVPLFILLGLKSLSLLSNYPQSITPQVGAISGNYLPLFNNFYLFVVFATISAPFGIDLRRSLLQLTSIAFFSLIAPITRETLNQNGIAKPLSALFLGQGIAASYSFLEANEHFDFGRIFLGAVTESGQLAISLVLCVGFVCATANPMLMARRPQLRIPRIISLCSLPLMIGAVILNLKRGPWAGCLVGTSCILWRYHKRALVFCIVAAVLLLTLVEPLRDRVGHSTEHFFISGGRSVIWEIGSHLATTLPLGIGYNNSHILRSFSDEIPAQLKHFHNNLLNILVETGWLGLIAFVWWILSLLGLGFKQLEPPELEQQYAQTTCWGATAAILSWQIAGLVEYNFGDSEILLMVFFVVGVLLSSAELRDQKQPADCEAAFLSPPG